MRNRQLNLLLAATLLITGCHKNAPKPIEIGSVLPNIPLPPDAAVLTRSGGSEALQFLFTSPATPDSVVAYYRTALSTGSFHLVNEAQHGKNTAFYAEQNGPSIWITVAPNGNAGSLVTIAGATSQDSLTMGTRKP